ncbi:MAG TPA: DNA repair protein RadA [bacterium]|nr:DNA repair protein RadA [bacterium]
MKQKEKIFYCCSECGYQSIRWLGKCPNCGSWNTLTEEIRKRRETQEQEKARPCPLDEVVMEEHPRLSTGVAECDRVLGGGLVSGSLILLAGEPGIGKSTLLISLVGHLASETGKVLYVSAEESLTQVKLRASRLGVSGPHLYLLATTELPLVKEALLQLKPRVVVIDSIQTIFDPDIPTTPGSVTQVRENTSYFMSLAKQTGISIFLVGHITKEGAIAGPKLLEHMVDVVLSFEGEARSQLRILRSLKNRFGATQEIGVFSMEEHGLREIPEASGIFLPDFHQMLPGAIIFPAQEGTRTLLVEVQSLTTPTYYGVPKRSVSGLDYNRVSMVLAVLEKKLHYNFGTHDVYINVGGGLKVEETGADLPLALSCVSSLKDLAPRTACVAMGELALTGEVRPIGQISQRLKEAARFGFQSAIVPQGNSRDVPATGLQVYPVRWLKEAVEFCLKGT